MNRTVLAVLSVSSLITVFGQNQPLPAFEVASVKPHPMGGGILRHPWSPTFQCVPGPHCGLAGNRFREESVGLAELIVDAWKVKTFQIAGLPAWGDTGY